MARDAGGQQPMTSERLAEIRRSIEPWLTGTPVTVQPFVNDMIDLLAEVERQRELLDSLARQTRFEREERDRREAALVALVERVATMLYIPLTNASGVTTREICGGCARTFRRDDSGWFSEDSRHAPECVVEQARALLASADERSGSDGQQPEQATCPVCGTPGRRVTSRWWCDGCNLPFRRPGEAAGEE